MALVPKPNCRPDLRIYNPSFKSEYPSPREQSEHRSIAPAAHNPQLLLRGAGAAQPQVEALRASSTAGASAWASSA
uniref:Uncharacterized protein n=1 Tax=Setaria viridis TaxID=4556 RepID=A0A4V6D4Q2_SETVI|nr:hypothetical protein SEVIR_7G302966v2 [Setaria viridis]